MHVLGIGSVRRRRAGAQEVNFWLGVLFRAGCAGCFCSGGDREMVERGGRGAGRTQRGGPEPLSLQESMSVLLKPSIQKTHTLYLLFSFPFVLFVNKKEKIKKCSLWWQWDVLPEIKSFFSIELFFKKKCKL